MTINPAAATVLCYGDSNTWGQTPDKSGRHPADVRWPGQMQAQLGDDYYVVEEGLSSRTTDLDYAKKPGRNGRTYLVPCLASHNPIELVIIMLGTNDLKIEFNRSPEAIAQAVKGLIADIKQYAFARAASPPQVLVVSPIRVDANAPNFATIYGGVYYDADSAAKSHQLVAALQAVATEAGCAFFDAGSVASAGDDGIHMDGDAHAALAAAMTQQVIGLRILRS